MSSLTEDEEKRLDNKETIEIIREGTKFTIAPTDVYCYGNIDFHTGSDDYKQLAKFTFLNHLCFCGIWVPADYNYDKHVCYSEIGRPTWYDTTRPEVLAQYVHGILGKPKRTIIFKCIPKRRHG